MTIFYKNLSRYFLRNAQKFLILSICTTFLPVFSHAAPTDHFVIKVETTSASTTFTIPTNSAYSYNYNVDWGNDGTFEDTNNTGNSTHDYGGAGIHTIRISGTFPQIYFNYNGDYKKILSVEQWGTGVWSSMKNSFNGCINLTINASDAPDLSIVTDMSSMFSSATSFNQNINNWDTSNVTHMSYMLSNTTSFNQPVGNWNTSNVIDMRGMFSNAAAFNQSINTWNTNNVVYMSGMFLSATSFNQPLNNWNTSNVLRMDEMFSYAAAFNQNISSWNTSKVLDMNFMFHKATSFNQPINNWDTSRVTDMSSMFKEATSFNQPIGNWNTSSVTDMSSMFFNATSFNQPIGDWDTSGVTNMYSMFFYATSFNQPIGNWDISNLSSLTLMFCHATSFNQPIGNWDTSNVTQTSSTFADATSFNQNIGTWNIFKLVNAGGMFDRVTLSVANYDALLVGWSNQAISNSGVFFSGGNSKYSPYAGATARAILTDYYGWYIKDGGINVSPVPTSTLPVPTSTPRASKIDTYGKNILVFPNPADGEVRFAFKDSNISKAEIDIFNGLGENICKIEISFPGQVISWNTSNIASGVYFYHTKITINGLETKLKVGKLAIVH